MKKRQAEYVARRKAAGYRRISFYLHELDFTTGYNAGRARQPLPATGWEDMISAVIGWSDGLCSAASKEEAGRIAARLFPRTTDADLQGS